MSDKFAGGKTKLVTPGPLPLTQWQQATLVCKVGQKEWGRGRMGGPFDFSVSPSPVGLDFGTFVFGLGLDI